TGTSHFPPPESTPGRLALRQVHHRIQPETGQFPLTGRRYTVRYSTAGWLVYHGSKKPAAFIPYHRRGGLSSKGPLRLILGGRLTVEVPVLQGHSLQPSATCLPVRLQQTHPRTYQAGPFIAILTSDGNRTFRGNRSNFIDLIRMGRKMGVTIFVLTPSGI